MSSARKKIATATMLVLGGISLSGCVSREYVDTQVAAVSDRVTALEARVQQNADAAAAANAAAQAASAQAQNANQRLDQLTGRVDALEARMASKAPRH
jgi:outer membrane murein-binding lipoprotein Lpp